MEQPTTTKQSLELTFEETVTSATITHENPMFNGITVNHLADLHKRARELMENDPQRISMRDLIQQAMRKHGCTKDKAKVHARKHLEGVEEHFVQMLRKAELDAAMSQVKPDPVRASIQHAMYPQYFQ